MDVRPLRWPHVALPTTLLALAYLAKPVAVVAIVPVCALFVLRYRAGRPTNTGAVAALLIAPAILLGWYDHIVSSHAEWHWASGITSLHVLPSLRQALTSGDALSAKFAAFGNAIRLVRTTMLGTAGFLLAIAGFAVLAWSRTKNSMLLWSWLAAELVYVFVVMTVEHVDYYAYSLLPLSALAIGGAAARYVSILRRADIAAAGRWALAALLPLAVAGVAVQGRAAVASYYQYNARAYRDAVALDRWLPPGATIVLGHYGPDVQYYIDRFGWEEDPLLWTPFDEQSAIRKGARYFISVEDNRLRRNLELCAWLQRFPMAAANADWPVYITDPLRILPGADRFWRGFRLAERRGQGRAFLDAADVCRVSPPGLARTP
jgi:hypothetical protein